MIVDQHVYRKAFEDYIRRGTPIEWSIKNARPTTHYVWRTRGDSRVRSEHAALDGQIFSWDETPPPGYHPGSRRAARRGCRCTAEPYRMPTGQAEAHSGLESVQHEIFGFSDSGKRWENTDFVRHFYKGDGKRVTLSEIGHEEEVARYWAYRHGALDNLSTQIVGAARDKKTDGRFTYYFGKAYEFELVEFSHGGGTVRGLFSGNMTRVDSMILIEGETECQFSDVFTDPVDARSLRDFILGRESDDNEHLKPTERTLDRDLDKKPTRYVVSDVLGTAYRITGTWNTRINAQVLADKTQSSIQ